MKEAHIYIVFTHFPGCTAERTNIKIITSKLSYGKGKCLSWVMSQTNP